MCHSTSCSVHWILSFSIRLQDSVCALRLCRWQTNTDMCCINIFSCQLETISVGWRSWPAFIKSISVKLFSSSFLLGEPGPDSGKTKPLFIKAKSGAREARSSPTASWSHIWEDAEGLMTLVAVNNDAHLRVYFWKTMIHTINSVVQWSVFPSSWQLPGVCFT